VKWEIVIGLETHVQLSTASKIFSGASTAFGAEPNTQASAVDIALPGVLPVLNKGAVERAIRFGLAINATIHRRSVFARKNYFYPDLPKGYQISQYELPIVGNGTLTIMVGDTEKTVRITRAHLEEDAGKSRHEDFHGMSGIDFNRAGTPLLEIVSEPDMRSTAEAVAYAKALHSLVCWIGICDGNMQEGSFRCDANVSVRPQGFNKLGTRCEIKNLNSFRFLEHAIDYEARRQIEILEDGGTVAQETRLYDSDKNETRSMRSKEDAMDYRYFPDPDLAPLEVSEQWIKMVKNLMPESPQAKRERYEKTLLLFTQDAIALTSSLETAIYFEAVLTELRKMPGVPYKTQSPDVADGKSVANWVINEVGALLNRDGLAIDQSRVSASQLAMLIAHTDSFMGTISHKAAKEVLAAMWAGEGDADAIIEKRGLKQISDVGTIEKIVDQVLAANPKLVEEFRAGKEKAFNALVGQVMKVTHGNANPVLVNELLKRELN
jgi:aspartyl-tRNA(Asn)/glutamyl-tRNA(Gln) amidotransferase subunit B